MSAAATAWLAAGLLLMASIYLGAGFSLVVFQFPGAGSITPSTFPERMGDPIKRATLTFTIQSTLMLVGGVVLAVAEWDEGGYRYAPLAYVVATLAATAWTVLAIFSVNQRLRKADVDPAEFRRLLTVWMRLNVVRFLFWVAEWLAMAVWFVGSVTRARR